MASSFLCVPVKKTFEVDMIKPLRNFIATVYSNTNPDEYNYALNELNKLRNSFIAKAGERHESALEVCYRYYDQLSAIDCKLPITENQVRINFNWQDAFVNNSRVASKKHLTIASGAYEKACVLFNVAAMQSLVVDPQNLANDDGLKMAAKLFQQSSGIFAHLASTISSVIPTDPTPDLQPDALNALSALMLAQAQDCFVRKAIGDNMKPGMTAKLSEQCSYLYGEAMKLMQMETVKGIWPKEWSTAIVCRQEVFHALALYYTSVVAKEAKEFGEEVARLKLALDGMAKAAKHSGTSFIYQSYQKTVAEAYQKAEKDNNFVYHAKVPSASTLKAIEKGAVAKPTPIVSPMSQNFKDLFERIVPMAVKIALSSFEERKSEIVHREISRLREATQILNGFLVSMNLPAAIEDLAGDRIPTSLQEKAAKVRRMGGIEHLTALTNDLPALLQRNKQILDESERALNEEEVSDRQLRAQFRQNWTRTPSEVLNQPIRGECNKYRQIINSALQADSLVRQRYFKNRDAIALLSQPDTDIERTLPSGNPLVQLQTSPVVMTLRQLMDQVREMTEERDVIEGQLKEAKCDMSSKFLTALAQDGAIYEQTLSLEQLDRIYGPLKERVAQSLKKQDTVITQVQKNYTEFARSKVQSQTGVSRDHKLKELASAYDSFIELKGNIDEGKQFYNDLTQLLASFQSKVNDFCFARKAEKDELLKDISTNLASQAAASPPPQPGAAAPQLYSNISVTRPPSSYGPAASPSPAFFSPALPRSFNPYSHFSVGSQPSGAQPSGAYQWR